MQLALDFNVGGDGAVRGKPRPALLLPGRSNTTPTPYVALPTPYTGVLIGDVGRAVASVQQMRPGLQGNATLGSVKKMNGPATQSGQMIKTMIDDVVCNALTARDALPERFTAGDTVKIRDTNDKAVVSEWCKGSSMATLSYGVYGSITCPKKYVEAWPE